MRALKQFHTLPSAFLSRRAFRLREALAQKEVLQIIGIGQIVDRGCYLDRRHHGPRAAEVNVRAGAEAAEEDIAVLLQLATTKHREQRQHQRRGDEVRTQRRIPSTEQRTKLGRS